MTKPAKPHTFVPFMPGDHVPLPSGPMPIVICSECEWRQPDPKAAPITSKDRKWFIKKWRFDFTDCDEVARAKAKGLPGTGPPRDLS